MIQIHKTTEYDLFKLNKLNRPVNYGHVKALQNKISSNDKTHLNPIIVNSEMEIVDGQHRFCALRELKKPIHYVIDNNFHIEDIAEFNVNQKNWKIDDYSDYYIKLEKPYYKEIKYIKDKYGLNWGTVISLTVGYDNEYKSNPSALFKSGNIKKIKNLNKASEIAEIIFRLNSVYKNINTSILNSIIFIFDNYSKFDFDNLLEKVELYARGDKLVPKGSVKEQLRFFEDVYNSKKQKKIMFSYDYEIKK